jgi:hypothetical protein
MTDKWSAGVPDIPEIPDNLEIIDAGQVAPSFDPRYTNNDTRDSLNVDAESVFVKADSIGSADISASPQPGGPEDLRLSQSDLVPLLSAIHGELRAITSILNEMR